jgi:hypothetical protein
MPSMVLRALLLRLIARRMRQRLLMIEHRAEIAPYVWFGCITTMIDEDREPSAS